jgi:hypothetical protein
MFWSSSPHSKSVFITQKCTVRTIMKAKWKDSYKELFSKLGILTLYSQYIYSTLMFVVKHKNLFALNMEFHSINTRHTLDLHVPVVNLSKVQKRVYYSGIKLFNSLPLSIKQVAHGLNRFKHKLKKFLILNSFYPIEEYLDRDKKFEPGFPSNYCLYLSSICIFWLCLL